MPKSRQIARWIGVGSFLLAATILSAQQPSFDGSWQMVKEKSQLNDKRTVAVDIKSNTKTITMTLKTRKGEDSKETIAEFTATLNGKACQFEEGSHTSKITVWYDGPSLNVCKENGPADDATSMWKLDISPDKQTMTMKISHYDPQAADETLVFAKAPTPTP